MKVSPVDIILDPPFTVTETRDKSNTNMFFGHRFGIPMEQKVSLSWFYREIKNSYLMKLYSIAILNASHIDSQMTFGTILYELLPYIVPQKLQGHAIDPLFESTGVMDDIFYSDTYHIN